MIPRPKIPNYHSSYLDEHLTRMENAIKEMRNALNNKDAQEFVNQFGALQWQERSILAGSKKLMEICNFTMADLMAMPLSKYEDTTQKEQTIKLLFELM